MKRLIAAAILLGFVIASYFTGYFYTQKTCKQAKILLKECVDEYKAEKNAELQAENLEVFWQEKEKILSFFANHNEIDEIEQAISTLKAYSISENEELFSEHSSAIDMLLHQLMEDTVPSIHSIF